MIVPTGRLLFWFGVIVVPFSFLGTALTWAAFPSAGVITLFLLVAALDAATSARVAAGVRLELPPMVRLSKDRKGDIELTIWNEAARSRKLRVGLAFPAELVAEREEIALRLPPGNLAAHYRWTCTPEKRGTYLFEHCYIEHDSRFGLWARRTEHPANIEVRVYPNLDRERKGLASLFLNRGDYGSHSQRHVGQGRDFEKLREYVHGDSYDRIHWKTTAKRACPVTKEFQVEKTQEVYVIIDASRLSSRPSVKSQHPSGPGNSQVEDILERFINATLVMGIAAERQGDHFGIVTFSDTVHRFVRAKSGRSHYITCRDVLYNLGPRTVTPDFDELTAFLSLRLRRRALLIFLTSLDDPALSESFQRNMTILGRKHLVFAGMMNPHGAAPLFSGTEATSITDIYQNLGGHLIWNDLRELERTLKRRGVMFSLFESESICPELVSRYMRIKERQVL